MIFADFFMLERFATKFIKIDADWIDQGWGNKKARLWLRLYRNEELICD